MTDMLVRLSSKYQVVIPKAARKRLGITKPDKQYFKVVSITEDEITFKKVQSLDDFLGAYSQAFPAHASDHVSKARDAEWQA